MRDINDDTYDDTAHDFIIRLCSEAGSIMEFASADAITIRSIESIKLVSTLDKLIRQTAKAQLLLRTAKAMTDEWDG